MSSVEQAWIFERLAVSVARVDFLDPALANRDEVRERGVRLEIRVVDAISTGSIHASPARHLQPAACRIDLLESAAFAADRMHWHPQMESGEPGDRTFDKSMVDDPLRWLGDQLRRADKLLTRSGVPIDAQMHADIAAVRQVVPDIVAAVCRGLEWARIVPWPDVIRDERGLATSSKTEDHPTR